MGIVMYCPQANSLLLQFREPEFISKEDQEFVAGCQATFGNLMIEGGAEAAFRWMTENLSNVVWVESPFVMETSDMESTLARLYQKHCT